MYVVPECPPTRTPPGFIIPALPTGCKTPPTGKGWIYEIKHDGYRLISLLRANHPPTALMPPDVAIETGYIRQGGITESKCVGSGSC
jgi:hypothetical protein